MAVDIFWDDILGETGGVGIKWCLKGFVQEGLEGRGNIWTGCKSVESEEDGS